MPILRLSRNSTEPGLLARVAVLAGFGWFCWLVWTEAKSADFAFLLNPVPGLRPEAPAMLAVPVLIWMGILWLPRLLWNYGAIVWSTAAAFGFLWLNWEAFTERCQSSVLGKLFGADIANFYGVMIVLTGFVGLPIFGLLVIYMVVPRAFIAFRSFVTKFFERPFRPPPALVRRRRSDQSGFTKH